MKVSSRFADAIHILCYAYLQRNAKHTSDVIAQSVNVNAVTVRQITGELREAGLIRTQAGSGRIEFARPIDEITMRDIFLAVSDGKLLARETAASDRCPIALGMKGAQEAIFSGIEEAALAKMAQTTLKDVVADIVAHYGDMLGITEV